MHEVLTEKEKASIRKDMALEIRDCIGSGYVPDVYLSYSAPFVAIAESWAREGYKKGMLRAAEIVEGMEKQDRIDGVEGVTFTMSAGQPLPSDIAAAIRSITNDKRR